MVEVQALPKKRLIIMARYFPFLWATNPTNDRDIARQFQENFRVAEGGGNFARECGDRG